ncbi:MAG TPA: MATE family efflux transporter, partial [Clostridia bacterium]|nr:MATE family efflux transporter [Clostridia bacterium]
IYSLKKMNFLNLRLVFEKALFNRIAKYSLLTSLQQSIMNFGILLVQGLVNSFGVVTMAAFAIGVKIDTFAYMPAQEFGNAFATYVAQNKGANKIGRIRKGFRSAIVCSTVFSLPISALIYVFAPNLVAFFSDSDHYVIVQGAKYLRTEGLFYILIGYLFIHYGFYRGLGRFNTSIFLTIISLGTRVLLSYFLVWVGFGVTSIWWSIVIGWAIADFFGLLFYRKTFTS